MRVVEPNVRKCGENPIKLEDSVNLVVDIGNSRIKLGVVDGGRIEDTFCVETLEESLLDDIFSCYPVDKAIAVCSRGEYPSVRKSIEPRVERFVMFDGSVPVPLTNLYSTPDTLGPDRLAAAVGARTVYPDNNILVVDFGTAITFDVVTAAGEYLGGNISPGAMTRYRALHDYTAALPLLTLPESVVQLGDCTCAAVGSGVAQGILYEVEGYIGEMSARYEDLKIIFTGGDANYFAKRLKSAIFATCDLIIYGLNTILEHNAKIHSL